MLRAAKRRLPWLLCLLAVPACTPGEPEALDRRIARQIPAEVEGLSYREAETQRIAHQLGRREPPPKSGLRARWQGYTFTRQDDGTYAIRDDGRTLDLRWDNPSPNTGGRIVAYAFDPRDNRTLWVGAASGGLWRSTDGGDLWEPMTESLPMLGVTAVAVHPQDSETILAGIGNEYAVHHLGPNFGSIGVLRSEDGGRTWRATSLYEHVAGQAEPMHSYALAWDPVHTGQVYLAASNGVWKSEDAGKTWRRVLQGNAQTLVLNPQAPETLYAVLAAAWDSTDRPAGVYRSLDGGATWDVLGQGLPAPQAYPAVCWHCADLSISDASPEVLYLSVRPEQGEETLYKTADGGERWEAVVRASDLQEVSGKPSEELWTVSVSPADPDVVFVGGLRLFRSTDGGTVWKEVGLLNRLDPLYARYAPGQMHITEETYEFFKRTPALSLVAIGAWVHEDHHAVGFDPRNPATVYDFSDGGVYKSTDEGEGWLPKKEGLMTLQVYSMDVALQDTVLVAVGAQDLGQLYLDPDYYTTEQQRNPAPRPYWRRWVGGDGMVPLIDQSTGRLAGLAGAGAADGTAYGLKIYGTSQYGNHWQVWIPGGFVAVPSLKTPGLEMRNQQGLPRGTDKTSFWVAPKVMDPVTPQILYTATLDSVYTSTFKDWRRQNAGEQPLVYTLFHAGWKGLAAVDSVGVLAVDRRHPDTVYAYSKGAAGPALLRSEDGGSRWDTLFSYAPGVSAFDTTYCRPASSRPSWPLPYLSDLEADPDVAGTLYATRAGYCRQLWRSSDAGRTWVDITGNLPEIPVNALAVTPGAAVARRQLYVGTDAGVFMAFDASDPRAIRWERVGGLPRAVVSEVRFHPVDGTIRVATYGRGYWKAKVPGAR